MATFQGVKLTRENGYINGYDVWRKHPEHPAMLSQGPDRGADWLLSLPMPGGERLGFKTFAGAVDGARERGIVGWTYVAGQYLGAWFSSGAGDPDPKACEVRIRGDGYGSGHICGRPAVGEVRRYGGRQVPGCKMHVGVETRMRERDQERREASLARQAERDHQRELTQASAAWAQRLADEFGIQAEGISCQTRLRVGVAPEALYARLVDLYGLLRDAGIDPAEELT